MEHDDLLRVFPDNNEKLILDECIENNFSCPSIPGCAFCISGICEYCKMNFQKIGNTCEECSSTEILFENTCQISYNLNTSDIGDTFNDISNRVVALKVDLESLSNFSDFSSPTNKFSSTIYYHLDDSSNEIPQHIISLLTLNNYSFKSIRYKILDEIGDSRSFNNSYGCRKSEFFTYTAQENFNGLCEDGCSDTLLINGYCVNPLFWCEIENLNNRCKLCNSGYKPIEFDNNTNYCLPIIFETDLIKNTENDIISLNIITCIDVNCSLCSFDGLFCYLCFPSFNIDFDNNCVSGVVNCTTHDNLDCLSCDSGYQLFSSINRCIPISSVISNCVNFDKSINQYCNLCDSGFFLYNNLGLYDCIDNNKKVDFCNTYSSNPNYQCTSCENNFFLFTNTLNITKCIENIYFKVGCNDYNLTTFQCIGCNTNFFFGTINNILNCIDNIYNKQNCNNYSVGPEYNCLNCEVNFSLETILTVPHCLDNNKIIPNCFDYNIGPNFECNTCQEKYIFFTNELNKIECIFEKSVHGCKEYDFISCLCIKCNSGFILTKGTHNFQVIFFCILNLNYIENCKNYDFLPDYTCLECNSDFFLYHDTINENKYCINNQYIIQKCKDYNISTNSCLSCSKDYFLLQKLKEDSTFKNICINSIYKISNCKDYEDITFMCIECFNDHILVNSINGKKLCIHNNFLISNCIKYNENLFCEEYNKICTNYNIENCPICKIGEILVNGECLDECSPKALRCELCQQSCPIYLCIKLIHFCLECDKNNFNECIRCDDNYILQDGQCIEK